MTHLDVLSVQGKPIFNDAITSWEYHTHTPYASTTYNNMDEIRLPIHQQDVYTLPSESFLYVEGTLLEKANTVGINYKLVNNAVAFLFEEARYEIGGVEVDRVKNLGVTSSIKNYLTLDTNDKTLQNAGWDETSGTISVNSTTGTFVFCYPLKFLQPVFDDYNKIILNVKQELVLLRTSNDKNSVVLPTGKTDFLLELKKVQWKIPYIRVDEVTRVKLLNMVDSDRPIQIPFRRWELHEYPAFPETDKQVWTVKTSSQLETARYVIVAFQTDKKGVLTANASRFNRDVDTASHPSVRNIRLYLNSVYFPYDHNHGDTSLFYNMYSRFKSSYHCNMDAIPLLNLTDFKNYAPLHVIDCSKQNETLKTGTVDVRLEVETTGNVPKGTTAYCLIVYDAIVEYSPLTALVRKLL